MYVTISEGSREIWVRSKERIRSRTIIGTCSTLRPPTLGFLVDEIDCFQGSNPPKYEKNVTSNMRKTKKTSKLHLSALRPRIWQPMHNCVKSALQNSANGTSSA